MSNFREAQRQAHPTKTNTLLLGVMCVLILILTMQIWLLTAALNESLDGHNAVKWPAFWVSLALFGSGAALLRYLPSPIRLPVREVVREAFPHAALAWRTLGISVVSLALAFAVWFMWSPRSRVLSVAGWRIKLARGWSLRLPLERWRWAASVSPVSSNRTSSPDSSLSS
jgi:hypothetical protein